MYVFIKYDYAFLDLFNDFTNPKIAYSISYIISVFKEQYFFFLLGNNGGNVQ